jgi:hypothetical protein
MKLYNVGLTRSIKNFPKAQSIILVFSTCKQNLSSLLVTFGAQFFDLDIENPLGRYHR